MLLTYNTTEGKKTYMIDDTIQTKVFADMCDGYAYIRRALDPNIENVQWLKLENNVLRVIFRRRVY